MKTLRGFGRALALLRTHRGWSQRDLARHTGIGRGLVSQYEGEQVSPKVETLDRLLNALEATLGDLAVAVEQVQQRKIYGPSTSKAEPGTSTSPLPEAAAYLVVPIHGDDRDDDPPKEPDPIPADLTILMKAILKEVARRLWSTDSKWSSPADEENGGRRGA